MNSIFNKSLFKKSLGKVLFFLCLSFKLNAYSDDLFMPLIDKADRARVEFNELYKYFLEQNPEVFKDSAENFSENFKLKPNISGRILENGPVLLNLISWLDKNKKNDAIGLLLLRKLNRFLYLEFRHFVGHLNVNKKYEGRLVGLLHNFYKFKVPAQSGSVEEKLKYEFPFQATISKAMLFILIVNASSLGYDEKVENVAYFLDKIRRELLEIKKLYSDDCNLRTADVSDFVELLQTYAAKEPLIGPNYLKRILIAVAIVAVIALVVWLAWDNVVRGQIENKIGHGWDVVSNKLKELIKSCSGLFVEGAIERLSKEETQDKLQNAVKGYTHEIGGELEQTAGKILEDARKKAGYLGRRFIGSPAQVAPAVGPATVVPVGLAPAVAPDAPEHSADPASTAEMAEGGDASQGEVSREQKSWFGGWFGW